MRQLLFQLSKESFVYGLSGALTKLIGLVLVPLYTRSLVQGDFGLLELLTTITSVVSSLIILGLDGAAALRFYQLENRQERLALTSTLFYFELTLVTLVSVALFGISQPLAELLFQDESLTIYLQLTILTVPFATLVTLFLQVARLARRPLSYLALSIGNLSLVASLVVVAVLVFGLGLQGVLLAILLGNLIFSVAGWWLTRVHYSSVFSASVIRDLLLLGLPLVPATVAWWVINFSNRWFLLNMTTVNDVALLGVAARLAAPVLLIVTAFQVAWVPFSLSIMHRNEAGRLYARALLYFLAVTFATLLVLTLFAEPLILILSKPEYLPAASVLALIGVSNIAYGVYYIVATGVNLEGKTLHIGWTTVIAAFVSVALNLALIPTLGIVGASVAGLIANLVPVVLLYLLSQRLHHIPYDLGRAGILSAIGMAALLAATLIHVDAFVLDVVLRLFLLFGFLVLLVPIGVVRVSDLKEVGRMVRGRLP